MGRGLAGARAGAIALASHLDSVPRGGAFDGPLGVVSAFLALDELGLAHGDAPRRPVVGQEHLRDAEVLQGRHEPA